MKSIKNKLVSNFVLVIFTSIFILELLLLGIIKNYYYNNTEQMLLSQLRTSADYYNRYFSNTSLIENIANNINVFWQQTDAQVQIINIEGKVLLDSLGVIHKENIETNDVKKALSGKSGKWIGTVDYDNIEVMAVSYPLESNGKIIGALRFITSLSEVNLAINYISLTFLGIGFGVLLITIVVSIFLANSITIPLQEVTAVAEKMASGNLSIRNNKINDDEIGKLSDTLNYMAEELQSREVLKNDFISSISHELRTPLTSIKGWAITLNDDSIDKNTLAMGFEIIEKEADRLTSMVEELLDFSKFVSGKISLKRRFSSVEELIEFIELSMTPRAERCNIKFTVDLEKNIPMVYMDENRIKQVLINIIDNAFKFTPAGGEISLKVVMDMGDVVITVTDTGYGISPEDLPRVTEKFYKGKSSKSKNGIGLSICDEIVKLHNGTMDFQSKLDIGTRVIVKIPINNKKEV